MERGRRVARAVTEGACRTGDIARAGERRSVWSTHMADGATGPSSAPKASSLWFQPNSRGDGARRMTKLRVLLLAGNSAEARLITEVLCAARATPIALVAAASTSVALNHLTNRRFDAVLLDQQQTDRSRADAIRAIRALDADLPIVILAANDNRLRIETLLSGDQECVPQGTGDGAQLVQALVHAAERANAKKALRASEERYHRFIERAPVAIFQADLEGRITLANPAWLELHGHPQWPAPEPRWQDTFVSAAFGNELLRLVVDDGRIRDVEAAILRRDGGRRTVLLSADTVPMFPDGPLHIEGMLLDVSDRRHAQSRFTSLLRGLPDALLVLNGKGTIVFANGRASELFGYSGAELRGQPITMLVPEDARAAHGCPVERYLAAPTIRSAGVKLDLSARKKDGSICPVEIGMSPLGGSGRRLVLCTVRDEGPRLKLEEDLRQARQMQAVGRLARDAARDLDGLLAAILDNLGMLEAVCRDQPRAEGCLNAALDAASRGATLVGALLEFSRRRASTPKETDVNELLTGMEPLLRCILQGRAGIRTDLATEPWAAHVDPVQLKLAILSLALSARSTIVDSGELVVATANREVGESSDADMVPGEYVLVRIGYDAGRVSQDVVADGFAEVAPCVIHALVRQSGGYTRFRSAGDGVLSVDIYLRRVVAWAVPKDHEPSPVLRAFDCERILLVDDDCTVRRTASSMLESLGYSVVTAASGPQALELLDHDGGFALLLTDIMPGGMTGVELVQKARERRPCLGVLYTTAYPDTVILNRRALHDGDKIIGKPYSQDDLARAVRDALR